eukprot:TRINITY_DN837_c0_g1_i3.p1 TRINITY_DN837_c0_g1~~TRINITY_DN837_c0_g1_i3.p1  ORF type:complete len:547 (+),score=71.43 TRINITY_DN837_c0_g1_i3:291-1931(+)
MSADLCHAMSIAADIVRTSLGISAYGPFANFSTVHIVVPGRSRKVFSGIETPWNLRRGQGRWRGWQASDDGCLSADAEADLARVGFEQRSKPPVSGCSRIYDHRRTSNMLVMESCLSPPQRTHTPSSKEGRLEEPFHAQPYLVSALQEMSACERGSVNPTSPPLPSISLPPVAACPPPHLLASLASPTTSPHLISPSVASSVRSPTSFRPPALSPPSPVVASPSLALTPASTSTTTRSPPLSCPSPPYQSPSSDLTTLTTTSSPSSSSPSSSPSSSSQSVVSPRPLAEAFMERKGLALLEDAGMDVTTAMISFPQVLNVPFSVAKVFLKFLQRRGLSGHRLSLILTKYPHLLTRNVSTQLVPLTMFLLHKVGIPKESMPKLLYRCPEILFRNPPEFEPTLEFFRSIGMRTIPKHLVNNPALLVMSLDKDLLPKRTFLMESLNISQAEATHMLACFPPLFVYSAETNLQPKVEYFVQVMGRSTDELVVYPQYFGFSLERKIQPRYEALVEWSEREGRPEAGRRRLRDILTEKDNVFFGALGMQRSAS